MLQLGQPLGAEPVLGHLYSVVGTPWTTATSTRIMAARIVGPELCERAPGPGRLSDLCRQLQVSSLSYPRGVPRLLTINHARGKVFSGRAAGTRIDPDTCLQLRRLDNLDRTEFEYRSGPR